MTTPTTLRDVAQEVNLSVSAVWKALADDPVIPAQTRQRVLEASRRLDYQPKRYRRKRTGRTASSLKRLALVLVGSDRSINAITDSLARVCQELNLSVKVQMLVVHTDEPAHMTHTLAEAAAENQGLILSGFVTASVLREVASCQAPHVVMGNTLEHPDLNTTATYSVTYDFESMGRGATRWLIDRGHRRIGFMAMETPLNLWYERWLAGYRHAHHDAGIPPDESLIVVTGKTSTPAQITADVWLGQPHPPTACVIPDPSLARRVMSALEERGRPMATDCIVIGSTLVQAEDYGVPNLPRMTADSVLLTRTCLNLLQQQARGEASSPYRIVLPHTFDNICP